MATGSGGAVYRSARNMYKTHRAPHRLCQLMNNINYCNVLASYSDIATILANS